MENFSLQKFDPSKSLFIEASAGTGKTYTIQLMVAKLISLGTPLKKILIVTYTEKAAGELKDRIRKKIDEVLVSRKLDKTIFQSLPRCRQRRHFHDPFVLSKSAQGIRLRCGQTV